MESSPRTLALRILAGLLAAVVGGSVVGSQVLESRSVPMPAATEPANPVAMTDAVTATPTPRVIAVPDATAAAPRDVLTPVPIPTLVTLPTKAATPAPPAVVTPGPMPTPTPAVIVTAVLSEAQPPTSVPAPTATAAPAPTIAAVVSAPIETPSATVLAAAAPSRAFQLEFAADAWVGGFYRGDGLAYGRPWSAVYGAFSAYPRAALSFDLDTTPDAETYFRVTGLDDEWATLNDIVLEVNGQAVYSGAAPFANWDGLGDGANAAWTTVQFTIPAGILRAGSNHIAVANLSQSGNFNMPPYVLLSDATLRSAPLDSVLPVSQPVEAYADPAPQKGKVKKTKEPKVKGPKKDRKNRNRKPGKKK